MKMSNLTYLTLDRDARQLRSTDADAFSKTISGGVLTAADADYDKARSIWNGTIDRRPALIARCLNDADVRTAVLFAGSHRMLASVRGGGHHIAGNAVAEGGMMIDLSGMRMVSIDADKRRATVGGGALLADFDHAAQAHGLATPLGINSTTGVAGLTLGGGFDHNFVLDGDGLRLRDSPAHTRPRGRRLQRQHDRERCRPP